MINFRKDIRNATTGEIIFTVVLGLALGSAIGFFIAPIFV